MSKAHRLTFSELAAALILCGEEELATGIIFANLGTEIDEKELKGRLSSATDSLLAKNYALWDDLKGEILLKSEIADIISLIAAPDKTLNISISETDKEKEIFITIFIKGADLILQETMDGIVYDYTKIESVDEVLIKICSALGFHHYECKAKILSEMKLEVLEKARAIVDNGDINAEKYLIDIGLDEKYAKLLVSDLKSTISRGYLIEVVYKNDEIEAKKGLLTLRGQNTGWIFRMFERDNEIWVTVIKASKEKCIDELRRILE